MLSSGVLAFAPHASASPPPLTVAALLPQRVSSDPYTGAGAQHATQVEPQIASYGSDVVGVFQDARYNSGGSAMNMGWVTSHDGGATWVSGILPGVTTAAGGPWPRTVNQSAFYDVTHHVWMIATLGVGLIGSTYTEQAAYVVRSTDGENWSAPIAVTTTGQPDKAWFVCDNGPSSPFVGRCYGVWQKGTAADQFQLTRSNDGGLTWSAPIATPGLSKGYNVQPVVQPNGTLVVVATDNTESSIVALRSTDGGLSLTNSITVSPITKRTVSQMRAFNKPSAAVSADGTVYTTWADCRFRAGCSTDDLVMTHSADGVTWTPVTRIALDAVSTTVDRFIPGLGVDAATSGGSTRMSVIFHSFPVAACGSGSQPACQLNVSMTQSSDGGATWDAPIALNDTPMSPSWLPISYRGRMVGDVFNVVYSGGNAVTLFPLATNTGSSSTFNQAMHAVVIGPSTVAVGGTSVSKPGTGQTATARFTIQLSQPQAGNVSVDYTTVDGTATVSAGAYQAAQGTVTIAAGQLTAAVDVTVNGTSAYAGNRDFSLRLSNPAGVSLARASATATIVDRDIMPAVSVSDVTVVRGSAPTGPSAGFTVSLNKPSAVPVSITYASADNTALAGSDYDAIAATVLTFAPGETSKTVGVQVHGTPSTRATTSFKLNLSNGVNASIADSSANGYLVSAAGPPMVYVADAAIAEGDSGSAPMTFQVAMMAPTDVAVSVAWSLSNGTAIAGTDYTNASGTAIIPAGSTSAPVPIAVLGNTTSQANRTFTFKVGTVTNGVNMNSTASGIILDDDGGHVPTPPLPTVHVSDAYVVRGTNPATGPNAVFQVFLNKPGTSTATVKFTTSNVSALTGRDYTATTVTVTFAPGETAKTVAVPVLGAAGSATTVSFKVTMSAPTNSTVSDAIGAGYLIADAGAPQVSPRDSSVLEGAAGTASMPFTIELSGPAALASTIGYATADGTATIAAGDYQAVSGTTTIPAGSTTAVISVPVNGNTTVQANRTMTFKITSFTGGTIIDTSATGTIIDDDDAAAPPPPPAPTSTTTALSVTPASPVIAGTAVSLTATLTPPAAVGSVQFFDGSTSLGTQPVASGSAALATSALAVGSHQLSAVFTPTDPAAYTSSTSPAGSPYVVNAAPPTPTTTSTALSISPVSPAPAGSSVTLTANLTPAAAAGSVEFFDGSTSLGTSTVAAGTASRSTSSLASGSHQLSAVFTPTDSAAYTGSTSPAGPPYVVSNAPPSPTATSTALSASPVSPVVSGTTVTLTATLTPAGAAGSVQFFDGAASLGTQTVASGTAALSTAALAVGSHQLSAVFTPADSAAFTGSTSPAGSPYVVNAPSSSITPVPPSISIADVYLDRGTDPATGPSAVFTVSLNKADSSNVTVTYATAAGTAVAGTDYTSVGPAQLTFAPGQVSKTISVPVLGTTSTRLTQTFNVNLSAPVNASIGDASATASLVTAAGPPQVLVTDSELAEGNAGTAPMTFQVGVAIPTTLPIVVSYSTVNGTGISGTDYQSTTGSLTIPAGGTFVGVPVSIIGNTTTQSDRAFTLKLNSATNAVLANSTATGTIHDDDGGHVPVNRPSAVHISDVYVLRGTSPTSGPGASYRVFLDKPSTSAVSVHYATTAVSALATRDYTTSSGTVSFAAGETSKVLTIPIFGSAGTAPTVQFKTSLSAPVNSYVSDAIGYANLLADAGPPQVFVRDASVAEGSSGTTPLSFTIELAGPAALPVVVTYATSDGTAKTASGEYVAASGSVTIPAGQLSASVAVSVNGNTIKTSNRAMTMTLTGVTGGGLIDTSAVGTILDDD